MRWLKITHNDGVDYLNVEQVYRVMSTGAAQVTFYDSNSILPTVYDFASAQEKNEFLQKFEKIMMAVSIDQLAPQG